MTRIPLLFVIPDSSAPIFFQPKTENAHETKPRETALGLLVSFPS